MDWFLELFKLPRVQGTDIFESASSSGGGAGTVAAAAVAAARTRRRPRPCQPPSFHWKSPLTAMLRRNQRAAARKEEGNEEVQPARHSALLRPDPGLSGVR